jgi:tetratricopeptide (TPR) repeat protein
MVYPLAAGIVGESRFDFASGFDGRVMICREKVYSRRWLPSCLVLGALQVNCVQAWATESPAPGTEHQASAGGPSALDASDLFWRGNAAYSKGDYAAARELYLAAFDVSGEAALLFNVAQCERRLGACDDARRSYERYVAHETAPPSEAQQWLAQLARECQPGANAAATGAAATALPTAGAPLGSTPSAAPVSAAPAGNASLTQTGLSPLAPTLGPASEPSADSTLTASARSSSAANDGNVARDAQEANNGSSPWTTRRVLGWSLLGAGVASGLTAGGFIWAQHGTLDDARSESQHLIGKSEKWDASGEPLEARAVRQGNMALGFGIAAGALVGAGVVILLFEDHGALDDRSALDDAGERAYLPMPLLSREAQGLSWGGRF